MHLNLLLVALGLAQHAFAFIPYKHGAGAGFDEAVVNRRSADAVRRCDRLQPLKRKSYVKRDNNFNINVASEPTQSDSVGINYDEAGDLYFVAAKFGTSDKVYQLLIDTGATESWVMGSSCESEACSLHTTLGPEDSTTLEVLDDEFSRTYGSGSVEGTLATDSIEIAGFEIPLTFGLVSNVTSEFEEFAMDGLLGLGRAGPSSSQTARLLDVLSEEEAIPARLYGIHLARSGAETNDGELNFGVPNTNRYDGGLTYTNLISDSEFWEIPMGNVKFDDNSLDLGTRTAIIDSGSSFVILPPADAEKLHDLIPGSDLVGDEYTIPCDTTESVQLVFSGESFSISPTDYVGPVAREVDEETCLSNFIAQRVFTDNQWVIGAVFLRNVYSVFDLDEERIGFGVKSDDTPSDEDTSENNDDEDDEETSDAALNDDTEGSEASDDEDGNVGSNDEASPSSEADDSDTSTATSDKASSSSSSQFSTNEPAQQDEQSAAVCANGTASSYFAFIMAMVAAFALLR